MPLMKRVSRWTFVGKNRVLTLECGHTKIYGARVVAPFFSSCPICTELADREAPAKDAGL